MILSLNVGFKDLAGEYGYKYLDLFSLMADSNNYVEKNYSLDGLHFTNAGNKVWVDATMPYVR